jgi:hypothetical protein
LKSCATATLRRRDFVRWQGEQACHEGAYFCRIHPTWQAQLNAASGQKTKPQP